MFYGFSKTARGFVRDTYHVRSWPGGKERRIAT